MGRPDRFLKACRRLPVDKVPVWLMRQAGRYMPEYRALRKDHSLLELVRDPDLAARNAATMGLLALVVRSDTHKVKQKTQLSAWQKFSTDFQSNATATARAFRAGDKTKIKPLYLKAAKACADCHSTFRAE